MMTFFFWLLLVLFVLVCIIVCFLVLIQSDKGGGISGTIGGGLGGASSLLGTQDTANILTKGTVIFGISFFVLCILMSLVMSNRDVSAEKSLLQKRAEQQQDYSPASVLDNQGGLPIRHAGEAGTEASQPLPPAGVNALPPDAVPVQPAPQGTAPK
jgi:preprotein translocase subunit SecG